ncbi:MAG: hypothetical protein EOM56_13255 [Deltaproteobacteria bacterium]|nr:hypothetical protein [Deltaproteobacteria bacterium]
MGCYDSTQDVLDKALKKLAYGTDVSVQQARHNTYYKASRALAQPLKGRLVAVYQAAAAQAEGAGLAAGPVRGAQAAAAVLAPLLMPGYLAWCQAVLARDHVLQQLVVARADVEWCGLSAPAGLLGAANLELLRQLHTKRWTAWLFQVLAAHAAASAKVGD